MPQLCSKQEALLRLFYNASSSFLLLFILFFSSSLLLLKFFNFIGNFPIIHRDQQYEYVFSEEEEEEEEEEIRYSYVDHQSSNITHERDHHLVADIIGGGESLVFLHTTPSSSDHDQFTSPRESLVSEEAQEEEDHNYYASDHQTLSVHRSPQVSDFETEIEQEQVQTHEYEYDSVPNSVPIETRPTSPTPITLNLYKSDVATDTTDEISISDDQYYDPVGERMMKNKKVQDEEEAGDDHKFFVFAPSAATQHSKRNIFDEEEEIYGDSCTVGSTSKSSSEWRSSVICRDSGTDDPFSSSSRRSCPKWESYTVFQKYDEEMTFLDRISAQKLHETESLKSIMVSPRSISERIVYKLAAIQKTPAHIGHNPYRELEAAYVAQICLTWEALNWNYHNFQSKVNHEGGCGASVAQQFQQFQVLLQRYVENEPYEHGRRPEIYARMRLLAPKLLLVPEYRESEEDEKEDNGFHSRISSESFVMIMEDGIRTFMNFLKADKEKPCQILAAYFRRNRRPSVDPTLLRLMKKVNQKKKMKVKDLRRSRKCLRKRKLKVEEEMQILMALIDLKIVSRVLRMSDLSEEQLHWCEEKMSKVRVMDAKLQRDPNPLFFPSH